MYTRLITTFLAIFSIVCIVIAAPQSAISASQSQPAGIYKVTSVKTDMKSNGFVMTIAGDTEPTFTYSERFDPFRIVIDIAEAEFDTSVNLEKLLPENKFSKLHLSVLKEQNTSIARFEFTLADNASYDVQRVKNNLEISIDTTPKTSMSDSGASVPVEAKTANTQDKVTASVFSDPQKDVNLLGSEKITEDSEAKKLQDSFSFSGYKNERISVDFYKIDLHNVFRLFRQITDLNIIVDESVNGSITLALTDVPWDFALDIILNLADLKKVERYNTIVIYPKDKEFIWPERAMDNLSFEADVDVVQEEALIIEQSANQPVEIMQAKEFIVEAKKLEKDEDYEDAVAAYEKAHNLWPDNTNISNKIANLYLGRLNQSSKAYFYAQKTLEKNPGDTKAALYCAISSANMDRIPEAMEFFAQSISETPPMKEAIISYAAFSENNNQADVALKLLDTYSSNYGDSVHTLVSKARILDKIGEREKASAQYRALLSSGFQLRPDLKQFVEGRLAAGNF